MADSSWDNEGAGQPAKRGWPTWAKVLAGCGVAVLLLFGACVGGGAWIAHQVKKDPEAFTRKAMDFAIAQIRPEWDEFRVIVTRLETDEGCRALYREHPRLAEAHPTESDFLAAAQTWRPKLEALPELDEKLLESNRVDIRKDFRRVIVSFKTSRGHRIEATWDRPMHGSGAGSRKLIALDVR